MGSEKGTSVLRRDNDSYKPKHAHDLDCLLKLSLLKDQNLSDGGKVLDDIEMLC